jgi:hypothetical protein
MGLKNMGATCYVNSYIQSLYMNPEFLALILSLDVPLDSPSTPLGAFQSLFAEMKYGISKFADPSEFISSFGIRHNYQEDSSEFSTLFLSWLQDQLPDPDDLRSFFQGENEITLTCSNCGSCRQMSEKFLELRLDLDDTSRDLSSMLTQSLHREEAIDGYLCESGCGERATLMKSSRAVHLPPYLQVVLNRYKFTDGQRRKLGTLIAIPTGTLLVNGIEYICSGFLEHISSSATSGHYVSHFKQDGVWWRFDDTRVTRTEGMGDSIDSGTVYMVFLSRKREDLRLPQPHIRILRPVQTKNEIIAHKADTLSIRRKSVFEQISERRDMIDAFRFDPDDVCVIDKRFFVSWCRGEDILGTVDFTGTSGPFPTPTCGHGDKRIHPFIVQRNLVKFIPTSVAEAMNVSYLPRLHECMCTTCVEELEQLLDRTVEYIALLDRLRTIRINFGLKCWENGEYDFDTAAVWVCQDEIPRIPKKIDKLGIFKKLSSTPFDGVVADITSGVACPHGVLVGDVLTDSSFALKPKKLIDDLLRLGDEIFPHCNNVVPRISAGNLIVHETGEGRVCEDCSRDDGLAASEWDSVKSRLGALLNQPSAEKFIPGVTYSILPSSWVTRVKSMSGKSRMLPDLKLNGTVVCPHGDLLADATEDKKSFHIVEVPDELLLSLGKFFRSPLTHLPIVSRDPINFIVSSAPPVCESCSKSSKKLTIRALPEVNDCFDTPQSLRPSRSKLVGVTQGSIDTNSLGLDVKLHLIDIGILEHSLYEIDPHDGLERLKIHVMNPKVRGALLEVPDGASISEVLGSDELDTVFVEFLRSNEPPKHKRRVSKKTETEDAGFKGSLLRDV